jgi:hypothetical protein
LRGPLYVCYSLGMTNTEMHVGQLITLSPRGGAEFEVLAIDDLSNDMVYAQRVYNPNDLPAEWYFTTYAAPVIEQEDAAE